MISLQQVSRSYNGGLVQAVKDFSLTVEKGCLYGLIGPDGAGKTTIFRILTTLLLPDSGTATVNGWDCVKDYRQIRRNIGYMPGRFSLYKDLTVEENLQFFATLFGTTIQANYHLISDIYTMLEPFKKRRAGQLSGGMKQKLALCCALVHKPLVLFLDEPTTGVDAVSRKEFWEMLRRLQAMDITILVSTPYMDEAARCDRIALLREGELLLENSPDGIRNAYPYPLYALRSENSFRLLEQCRAYDHLRSCYAFGESLHFSFRDDSPAEREAFQHFLNEAGYPHLRPEPIQPGIEDTFLHLLEHHHA